MNFPDSYFEDEVREGFYVSSLMKRSWAAQLEVLKEVTDLCDRHGIRYFGEWGTLLGAVRHGGFVPWDDDMDICMTNKEFIKFVEVMKNDPPEGLVYVDFWYSDNIDNLIVGVRNSNEVILTNAEKLKKYHGFPYIAGIDLFRLDYLPPDEGEREYFCNVMEIVARIIVSIKERKKGNDEVTWEGIEDAVCKVEKLLKVTISRDGDVKQQLYSLIEERLAFLYTEQEADELTHMPVYLQNKRYRLRKEFFREPAYLTYENFRLPVSPYYEHVINRHKYGDYMHCLKAGGSHGYPYFGKFNEYFTASSTIRVFQYVYDENRQPAERRPKETLMSQVKGFLPLFTEAHEVLLQNAREDSADQVLELLGSCQDSAVQIANMIEEKLGEDHVVVALLAGYCETLYRFYTQMVEEGNQAMELCEDMEREFARFEREFEKSIETDLKEKKEVVFVPYKASLWPAMDSVWRAAREDKDAEVYVIPAPYFYKDEFGRVKTGEVHYETEGYPEDVVLTSYENYNFEVHHPDTIVIQCPYDEYNYGMTIHSFFYASNLEQYTDQLVYIPALVMDEIGSGDDRAKEMLKSYCNMPGIVHADKVFVQSERMKEVYVELLTQFAGEDTKEIWEEKIYGLGCPAYDYESRRGQEEPVVPEDWQRVIQKPDGSRKKVLLYVTSASVVLCYGKEALEKMREVLQVFKEAKDEMALLWRPDPEAKDMLRKRCPGLWGEYRDLVAAYREEAWGIYDDSDDDASAISLCDACYGDGGKTLNRCRALQKPAIWNNWLDWREQHPHKKTRLVTEDCLEYKGELWFVERTFNAVFRLDKETGNIRYECSIPQSELLEERIYSKIVDCGEELCFVPVSAEDLWIYHTVTKEWRSISFLGLADKMQRTKFYQAFIHNEYLYMLGDQLPFVIRVDIHKSTWKKIPYDKENRIQYRCYTRTGCVRLGAKVYVVSANSHHVLEFDMDSEEIIWHEVGGDSKRYSGIAYDGTQFWLSPSRNTGIAKWDGGENAQVFGMPKEFRDEDVQFDGVAVVGEQIIFPGYGASTFTSTIYSTVEKCPHEYEIREERFHFFHEINSGDVVSLDTKNILKVWSPDGETREYRLEMDKEELLAQIKAADMTILSGRKRMMVDESELIGPGEFLYLMEQNDRKASHMDDRTAGAMIYEAFSK